MIPVDFEHFLGLHVFSRRLTHGFGLFGQHLFHFNGDAFAGGEADRVALQTSRQLDVGDLAAQGVLDAVQQPFRGLALFFADRLFFVGHFDAEVVFRSGFKGLVVVGIQHLQRKFVHFFGAEQDFVALVHQHFVLRHSFDLVDGVAGGVVNVFLIFLHAVDVFLEGDQLVFGGAVEHDEVFQLVLVGAEIVVNAEFQTQPEIIEEFFVTFTVFGHHILEFGDDLLFEAVGNGLNLAVLLEHFPGNIQ